MKSTKEKKNENTNIKQEWLNQVSASNIVEFNKTRSKPQSGLNKDYQLRYNSDGSLSVTGLPPVINQAIVAELLGFGKVAAVGILKDIGMLLPLGYDPKQKRNFRSCQYLTSEVIKNLVDKDWMGKAAYAVKLWNDSNNNNAKDRKDG